MPIKIEIDVTCDGCNIPLNDKDKCVCLECFQTIRDERDRLLTDMIENKKKTDALEQNVRTLNDRILTLTQGK